MLPSTQTIETSEFSALAALRTLEDKQSLTLAFKRFSRIAVSLERAYSQLQMEVARLREELASKQNELDREREMARRAQALAEFSAILAHEVRNPLAAMELFTDLLLESGDLKEEARTWTEHLQAGLRSLTTTANNVLQLHAVPSASQSLVHLGYVLTATVDFMLPVAKQARLELRFRGETTDSRIVGETYRLRQVFLNLMRNAFQAMRPGGILEISMNETHDDDGGRVEIRFTDSGAGIQSEDLARVFDTGFTTKPDSVGLGLAVSREIVEQHGGSIRAESAPGKGSTFIISFPTL